MWQKKSIRAMERFFPSCVLKMQCNAIWQKKMKKKMETHRTMERFFPSRVIKIQYKLQKKMLKKTVDTIFFF